MFSRRYRTSTPAVEAGKPPRGVEVDPSRGVGGRVRRPQAPRTARRTRGPAIFVRRQEATRTLMRSLPAGSAGCSGAQGEPGGPMRGERTPTAASTRLGEGDGCAGRDEVDVVAADHAATVPEGERGEGEGGRRGAIRNGGVRASAAAEGGAGWRGTTRGAGAGASPELWHAGLRPACRSTRSTRALGRVDHAGQAPRDRSELRRGAPSGGRERVEDAAQALHDRVRRGAQPRSATALALVGVQGATEGGEGRGGEVADHAVDGGEGLRRERRGSRGVKRRSGRVAVSTRSTVRAVVSQPSGVETGGRRPRRRWAAGWSTRRGRPGARGGARRG